MQHIICTLSNNEVILSNWAKNNIKPEHYPEIKETMLEIPDMLSDYNIELIGAIWETPHSFYFLTRKPTKESQEDFQSFYEEIIETRTNALIETHITGNILTIHINIPR